MLKDSSLAPITEAHRDTLVNQLRSLDRTTLTIFVLSEIQGLLSGNIATELGIDDVEIDYIGMCGQNGRIPAPRSDIVQQIIESTWGSLGNAFVGEGLIPPIANEDHKWKNKGHVMTVLERLRESAVGIRPEAAKAGRFTTIEEFGAQSKAWKIQDRQFAEWILNLHESTLPTS